MKKIAISWFSLFIFTSCFTIPKKVLSNSYPEQPRRDQYHFSRKAFEFNSNIDTSAVYMARQNWHLHYEPEEKIRYSFIRFSGDGVAFKSKSDEKLPGGLDFNEMINGQFCLYKIHGKKVIIEMYDRTEKHFFYFYGQINDSSLVITEDRLRPWWGAKENLNLNFIKTPTKLTHPVLFPH